MILMWHWAEDTCAEIILGLIQNEEISYGGIIIQLNLISLIQSNQPYKYEGG